MRNLREGPSHAHGRNHRPAFYRFPPHDPIINYPYLTWLRMSTSLPFPSSPHCAPRTTSMPYEEEEAFFGAVKGAAAGAPFPLIPRLASMTPTLEEISLKIPMTVSDPPSHLVGFADRSEDARTAAPPAVPAPRARATVRVPCWAILLNILRWLGLFARRANGPCGRCFLRGGVKG